MQDAGIDLIPSNDFSLYDQVLDAVALVGAVPERYGHSGGDVDLDTYFAMARGRQADGVDVTAMEMTKWFDTNYHYIVPELGPDTRFSLSSSKPFDEFTEAQQALGISTVPVLIGPVSLLLLAKPGDGVDEDFDRISLIEPLLGVYGEVIERLAEHGAEWVQLDEPCFVMDRSERELDALRLAYEELSKVHERTRLLVKTYFDHVGDAYAVLRETARRSGSGSTSLAGAREHGHRPRRRPPRRQDAVRRHRRRPQRLDQRPARQPRGAQALRGDRRRGGRLDLLLAAAHARSTSTPSPISTTSCAPGWPSPSRRWARSRCWRGAAARAPTRSRPSWPTTSRRWRAAASRSAPATQRCASGSRHWTRTPIAATAPSRRAARPSAPSSTCLSSRPRRSAPTRRPRRSAPPAPSCARARSTAPSTSAA